MVVTVALMNMRHGIARDEVGGLCVREGGETNRRVRAVRLMWERTDMRMTLCERLVESGVPCAHVVHGDVKVWSC